MTETDRPEGLPNVFRERATTFLSTMQVVGRGALDLLTGTARQELLRDSQWEGEEKARDVVEAAFVCARARRDYETGVLAIEEVVTFFGKSICFWHQHGEAPRVDHRLQQLQEWRAGWATWNDLESLPEIDHLFKPEEWVVISEYLPQVTEPEPDIVV